MYVNLHYHMVICQLLKKNVCSFQQPSKRIKTEMSDDEMNSMNSVGSVGLAASTTPIVSSVCGGISSIVSTTSMPANDLQRTHAPHYVQQDQTLQQHNGEYLLLAYQASSCFVMIPLTTL